MIHDLKPYPAYKDSDVPWLGKVPEHWGIKPLKRWVRMNAEVLPETLSPDHEFGYIDIGAVGTGILNQKPQKLRFGAAPSRARRVLRKGDTILSTVRTYLKAVFFVTEDDDHLVCSTGFAVLTSRSKTAPKFVSYLVQSSSFTDRVTADSVGIAYPAIAEGRLGSFHVAVPPPSEQSAIVRFLDHADRRIRRYIRAKQKLIKLLEEQKQAIIHRAVTRGLDPNVRLKPSGVVWLGDVPGHWEVRPAKYFFREVDERSATGAEELLSVSHITGVTPRSQKNITMFMASSYVGHKVCRAGDLVINTMWAWMAALGIARQTGIVSPSYGVYRPVRASRLLSDYADLLLRTKPYVGEYGCRSTGIRSSRLRLYPEQFLRIRIICPPIEEQQTILDWVRAETAAAERTIAGALREITLLREYRTRLVADVVMGKLDVRAAAAKLPEEADESEPLDDAEALADGDEEIGDADLDAVTEEAEA